MKTISILGSTGSIGTQSLDVIRNSSDFKVVGLSTNSNIDLIEKQAIEFRPQMVGVMDEEMAQTLKKRLKRYNIKVVEGINGLIEIATESSAETIITSVVGIIGLVPTLEAIKEGKNIALANKETLVTAGELVMAEAMKNNVNVIPIDSEHSAIFQCMKSGKPKEIRRIILTASGGPFRGRQRNDLENVTVKEALNHPNWSMGKKITIDSATLMNKGLEVIEAKWLFDIDIDKIDVIVHPQSVIHSMVEFIDGNIIAQMGIADMRIPIQYALNYPNRIKNSINSLNLIEIGKLSFESPDINTFECLRLAIYALEKGGTMPAVLNAANEVAVDLFLNGKIKFLEIPEVIKKTMYKHNLILTPNLDDILEADKWARQEVLL